MIRCHKYLLVVIAIGLVLVACSPPATEESPTIIPADTPSPTDTPDQAAIPAESRLSIKCVETSDAAPDTLQFRGRLFVVAVDEGNKTYFWGISDDRKIEVDTGTTHVVISPDRARLAAINRRLEALVIFNADGTLLLEVPEWGDELDILQWLKDNQLAVKMPHGDTTYEPDAIFVFDIATKERLEILPELPLITDSIEDLSWGGYSISPLVPNPQFTHLIYPANAEADNSFILWDRQNEIEVKRIYHHDSPNTGIYLSAPAWSQDGSSYVTSAMLRYAYDPKNDAEPIRPLQAASEAAENPFINVDDPAGYIGGFELIRVNQNGETQRLTYLTTTFNASQEDWVWSPDGTRIAFWLTIEDDAFPVRDALAVLDVNSGEVTNYCISGYRTPVWSPDGSQIAINQNIEGRDTFKIVDLEAGVAYNISGDEAIKAEGWMLPPP